MDGAFELPIHITYRPPGWLAGTLIAGHAGTIICVLVISVPIWLKLVMVVAIIASYLVYWRIYVQCTQLPSPIELILSSEDEWKLVDATGAREVQLLPESLVHPALLVLRIRDGNRVHPFILTPQTVDRDVLRRLRVRLRFQKNVRGEE